MKVSSIERLRSLHMTDDNALITRARDMAAAQYKTLHALEMSNKNKSSVAPETWLNRCKNSVVTVPTQSYQDGIVVMDIRTFIMRYPQKTTLLFTQVYKHSVEALVDAMWERCVVVYVPPGVVTTEQINIYERMAKVEERAIEKIVVIVDTGASVRMLVRPSLNEEARARMVTCIVRDDAHLNLLFDQHVDSQPLSTALQVYAGRNAQANAQLLISGAGSQQWWIRCDAHKPYAHITTTCVALHAGSAQVSVDSLQLHEQPHTSSVVQIRKLLAGSASGWYNGMIHIATQARGACATQTHKALLLSENARAIAKPSLQVLTNEVQCTHASAVGKLDKDQILYGLTRGVQEQIMHRLLLEGFAGELFEDRVRATVMERIGVVGLT